MFHRMAGRTAVILGALAFGLTGCAAPGGTKTSGTDSTAASTQTIVISDREAELGTPDLATISFGIQSEEADAEAVQKANSATTNKVIKALQDLSIQKNDIQTASYNLYPQYDYTNDSISGYQARTTLCVKNQPVDQVGAIVAAAVDAGANTVSDIQYSCSAYQELYNDAMQSAIRSAREKAEAAASAAGKSLGEIVTIEESSGDDTYRSYSSTNAAMEAASADSASLNIMPGQVEITAEVTVTYTME